MASKKKRTGTGSINDDLIIEILFRVSTMEILHRCKAVCTSWKRLISHPSLMNRFIKRLKCLPPRVTGVYFAENTTPSQPPGTKFLDFCDQTIKNSACLSFLPHPVLIVASHKGYVLCMNNPKRVNVNRNACFRYTLRNPITKECLELPYHRVRHYINFVFLFCYEKEESDGRQIEFKVVCFYCGSPGGLRLGVSIYSSEENIWKKITANGHFSYFTGKKISHDQFIYYMNDNQFLAVCDMMKESIRFLRLPKESWTIHVRCKNLGISAGLLYFSAVRDETCLSVWELVDRVHWYLKHQIDFRGFITELPQILDCKTLRALAFHPLESHLVLMSFAAGRHQILFLYNIGTGKIELVTDNCNPDINLPIVPYCLPAWVPFLKKIL